MGIFSMLGKTVLLPISIVRDVATMGGVLEGKTTPNTLENLKSICDEIDDTLA